MSRLTNRILLAAFARSVPAPGIVRSQGFNARTLQRAQQRGETGNLYGTNPYEQTGEEGEEGQDGQPQDTTKKERRIRKPLESYFFQRFDPRPEQFSLERQSATTTAWR